MNNSRPALVLFCVLLAAFILPAGCGGESQVCRTRAESGPLIPGCSDSHRPVIFVHGMFGSGDNYTDMVQRFLQNGYCPEKISLLDYDTADLDIDIGVEALSDRVDELIAGSGFDQVDLIGHSMGGAIGATYVNTGSNADKIAHYVHAASGPNYTFPSGLAVRSISSYSDIAVGFTDIPGIENIEIPGADHFAVISREESFAATYEFFNDGAEPVTTTIIPQDEDLRLEGKAVSIGDNVPMEGARIEIYPLDPDTGERTGEKPAACFLVDAEGEWGVFEAEKDTYYEMTLTAENVRVMHYYYQPFLRSQPTVYLLSLLGQSDSVISKMVNQIIPFDDNMSVVALFSASHAIHSGRDTASVDGYDLATPELADPIQDTIAYFLSDQNHNGISDYTQGMLSSMPFLANLDYFIPTSTPRSVRLEVNGSVLNVRNWKSDTEGIIFAVFNY